MKLVRHRNTPWGLHDLSKDLADQKPELVETLYRINIQEHQKVGRIK